VSPCSFFSAIIVIERFFLYCDFEWLMNVIGENMSANIGRRKVVAVEARIQIDHLKVPIQIDLDVPHLVLNRAPESAFALKWILCAQSTKMRSQLLSQFGYRCRISKCTAST
jgi:hypothetical protein